MKFFPSPGAALGFTWAALLLSQPAAALSPDEIIAALMRPVLRTDTRRYQNHLLEVLDQAEPGSILVYVMQDGLEIAAMGNLMGTTAKVRGLAGAVIDGAVRDTAELKRLEFPVWSRRVSPATSVGRMISVDKQIPVLCAGVMVRPGDYLVGDPDGVVVVPADAAEKVVALAHSSATAGELAGGFNIVLADDGRLQRGALPEAYPQARLGL